MTFFVNFFKFKSDLKKSRICSIWGQSEPISAKICLPCFKLTINRKNLRLQPLYERIAPSFGEQLKETTIVNVWEWDCDHLTFNSALVSWLKFRLLAWFVFYEYKQTRDIDLTSSSWPDQGITSWMTWLRKDVR